MTAFRVLLAAIALVAVPGVAAEPYRGPIIDVHLHSYPQAAYAVVPMAATTTFLPPDLAKSMSPPDAAAHRRATLAEMKRWTIVRGYVSVDVPASGDADDLAAARAWLAEGEGRVVPGLSVGPIYRGESPDAAAAAFKAGTIGMLGELQFQYEGVGADDPRYDRWFGMAEALDIPVGIHTGPGPPRAANNGTPNFRLKYGDPRLIETVLVKHPKLRAYIMHAGWPYLAETKAMLEQYPELYADVSAIDWLIPREEFHDYVKALIRAGFGDRLMFGSDQMLWPQGIGLAIASINDGDWITADEKKAILHDNAARFFRLKV